MASSKVPTTPTASRVDKIEPLASWTVTAIELAAEKKRKNEDTLVMLHWRDIRRMLANLHTVMGIANYYRVKAMHWIDSEEAEELGMMMEKLTQGLRASFGYLLLTPLEYLIRRASQSDAAYPCSTAAALAYGKVFLMLEGIAEIVDEPAARKIGRHLA